MLAVSADSLPTVFIVCSAADTRAFVQSLLGSAKIRSREFPSGDELLGALSHHDAGCAVLDLQSEGLKLQAELARRGLFLPIIFLTDPGEVAMVVAAMQAGAQSVLEKPCNAETLMAHINKALVIDQQKRQDRLQIADFRHKMKSLTAGEKEVLELLCAGFNNWRIAATLNSSRKTIEARRAKLMRKLEVDNLPDLVRLALRAGSDGPESPPSGS